MANTILHKRSSTASAVPLSGDLSAGELALNTADGKIFMKDSGGTVIDIVDHTAYTDINDVLTDLQSVDGAGSGLDADNLDGNAGSYYLDFNNFTNLPDPTITLGGDASGSLTLTDLAGGILTVTVQDDSHNHIISNVDGLQTALDGKLSDSGDTMNGAYTVSAGGSISWAATPSTANHLTNKSYVDNLVSQSVAWRPGLVDSDLVDVVGSNPATPESTYSVGVDGDIAFIATASFTFSYGTGSTVAATAGSIVNLHITSSGNGDYTLIEHPLSTGDRFIIAAEHGTIGSGLSTLDPESNGNLADGDLIEFTGTGDGSTNASWTMPEGRSGQATHSGTEIAGGTTVLNQDPDSTHYGHTYLYNSEDNAWVEIAGPGFIEAGDNLSYSGSVLNVVDGPGSGLDADTLDGVNSLSFLRSDEADSHSGTITPSSDNSIDLGAGGARYANVYAVTFQGEATSAQYADLAEMYTADAEIMPGTVVCFGGEKEVTTCTHDMDRKVAGVVSTNPAYLMNADSNGVAVALQGRVPCKVSGTVRKGDMMVSDGKGGARAEENPAMGSVIGKALENSEGDNVIEVVVGRM